MLGSAYAMVVQTIAWALLYELPPQLTKRASEALALAGDNAATGCKTAGTPGRLPQLAPGQSCWVASAAPAAMACILAQAMSGYTRLPYPQSVPAMTFSRPIMLA